MTNTNTPQPPNCPPNQAPGDYPPGYCQPEDEISLLDLLLVLLKHKKMIMSVVAVAAIAAVVISLLLPNIYRSEATIVPQKDNKKQVGGLASALGGFGNFGGLAGGIFGFGGNSDVTQLEVALMSRELAHRVINKHKLMPILFKDGWDADKKTWTRDKPPTEQDAFRRIKNLLSIKVDNKKNTLNVGFDHRDPQFAKDMVDRYLTELSEMMRETTISDASEKIGFVQEELGKTSDALLRDKLYTLLASEIEKETFARAQKYYNFEVIDPPIVPDPDKKVKPKRSLIFILAVFVAFFGAVLFAFLTELFDNLSKTADSSQLEALGKHLPGLLRRRFQAGTKS